MIQQRLYDLIATHEDWLMNRVLYYARLNNYTKYTSTLAEAWRMSIQGLSESLMQAIKESDGPPEFGPDDDFTKDPIASFGIIEAQRHRSRGITLSMFLGLMKYYKQGYIDLVIKAGFDGEYEESCRLFIDRFFDRIEIGFTVEWSTLSEDDKMIKLQSTNRTITNEKNKYLTIFESTPTPVIFLNTENTIDNLNHAAATLIYGIETPGSTYYAEQRIQEPLPWKIDEVTAFFSGNETEYAFERALETKKGVRYLQIKLKKMLDVSQKFSGIALILNDITERKRAEEKGRHSEKLSAALEMAGAICHELNQPLQIITGRIDLLSMECKDERTYKTLELIKDHVHKMGIITKKLMGLRQYSTRDYIGTTKITDINTEPDSNDT